MRVFALSLAVFSSLALAHTIPDDVAVQAFARPEPGHFRMLVRVPFNALADTVFPLRDNGALDLEPVRPMLTGAARIWIADWIDLYQHGQLLPKPQVVSARIAPVTDRSFSSYEFASTHLASPALSTSTEIFPARAMFDVALDWPLAGNASDFAIRSRLARLGGRVVTSLQYIHPPFGKNSPLTYGFVGDPGIFSLRPRWYESVGRFFPLGVIELTRGGEYLLLLLCIVLRFPALSQLRAAALSFGAGIVIALIAASYGWVPEGLWFPILFETIIALSLVYMAFETIWPSSGKLRWPLFGFGLAHGCGLALALRPVLQFGGSNTLTAVLSFGSGAFVAVALVVTIVHWISRAIFLAGVPARIATIFLAAIAAHTGWHRMLERAKWLGTFTWQWPAFNTATWLFAACALVLIAAYFFRKAPPVKL